MLPAQRPGQTNAEYLEILKKAKEQQRQMSSQGALPLSTIPNIPTSPIAGIANNATIAIPAPPNPSNILTSPNVASYGTDVSSIAAQSKLPEFYTGKFYEPAQQQLSEFGSGLLKGEVPDYYKPIGEAGSKEFENMLNLVKRDIQQGTTEQLAQMGVRSARGAGVAATQIADAETKLRYEDYARALTGKQTLLTTGVGTISGVRDSDLTYGGQKNAFELDKAGLGESAERFEKTLEFEKDKLGFEKEKFNFEKEYKNLLSDRAQETAKSEMIGDLLSSGIGIASNIYTANKLKDVLKGVSGTTTAKTAAEASIGAALPELAAVGGISQSIGAGVGIGEGIGVGAGGGMGIGAGAGMGEGIGVGVGTETGIGTGVAAGGSSVLGSALVVALPLAAIALLAVVLGKKESDDISPDEVRGTANQIAQSMPQTVETMVQMREQGVWDEGKNLHEHVKNIELLKKDIESRGEEFIPEDWDNIISSVMAKGESWEKEQAELLNAVDKKFGAEDMTKLQAEYNTLRNAPIPNWERMKFLKTKLGMSEEEW